MNTFCRCRSDEQAKYNLRNNVAPIAVVQNWIFVSMDHKLPESLSEMIHFSWFKRDCRERDPNIEEFHLNEDVEARFSAFLKENNWKRVKALPLPR